MFNIITAIFVEATLIFGFKPHINRIWDEDGQLMSVIVVPSPRNGLKETETQRKYAKAYETSYMTEQLAKLVVCVASQTQMMRARTLSAVLTPGKKTCELLSARKTIRGLNSDGRPGAEVGVN